VESIPEGLIYSEGPIQPTIFDSWLKLIALAKSSIDIASFYWTLKGEDVIPHPSASQVYNIIIYLYYKCDYIN